jgi:ABC-type transport system substrate-binding protein
MHKNIGRKEKMQDKTLVITSILVAALMLSITTAPSFAFIYPTGKQDNYFELFGPRIDQILIKKYANLNAEILALQAGEIDFTDWALEKTMILNLANDTNIAVVSYGGEAGYYTMNFNNNGNEYLGNPQDPLYENPVYPNPFSVKYLRQACSYLVDRQSLVTDAGAGMYEAIYVPVPKYMAYFTDPEISYTGLSSAVAYPPSITDANDTLNNNGFPVGPDGYHYWDMDLDGVKDTGEDFTGEFYTRGDALRKGAGDMLCNGLTTIGVKFNRHVVSGGQAWQTCMVEKNYHLYTAGWIFIGPDADFLFDLYHWDNYYHPEDPPNYGGITWDNENNIRTDLANIKFSPDAVSARAAAYAFEYKFAEQACECPLASTSAPKAYNKWYTGGNDGAAKGDAEDKYRNQPWNQIVNEKGQGENSYYTFLNAYPGAYQYGDGNMIVRYGWEDNTMPQTLNPMYSSWYWESEAWGKCYDGLGGRDPMTKGPIDTPALAENWTVGTWVYPIKPGDPLSNKTLSMVTVTIRPDVLWSDGEPFTIEDVIYTFCQMPTELRAKHAPDVWWQPTLDRIIGFYMEDPYTVRILLDVYTYIAGNWIVGNVIIPKHIWQPFIRDNSPIEITGDLSGTPSMLIGTGPFIYKANTAQTLLLERNPTYYQTMDKAVMNYEHFDVPIHNEGIIMEGLVGLQMSAYWMNANETPASVKIKIPITNLDVNDEQDFNKTVVLEYPNGTMVTLLPETNIVLLNNTAYWEEFTLNNLGLGVYKIHVTIKITSGPLYDWVQTQPLSPTIKSMILGPRTIEKKFWITIPADLNFDATVDIFDIVTVGAQFGGAYNDPDPALRLLYSPLADVNQDYIVDIFDIVTIATAFGWPL